jgi:uncharacterized protein (TIGR03067 family)
VDDVWAAFTTKAGMETWLWKEARVDLRPGGDWLVLFSEASTGGGTIVSFEPKRRLVVKALAPGKFPTVRKEGTTATFEFEPYGRASTRVTLIQTGWREGKEWDDAYEYLASGNAQLLMQLWNRFVTGPMDWSEPAPETIPKELVALQGTWVITSGNGQAIMEGAELAFVISGDKYTQTLNGVIVERGSLRVDASRKLMAVDFVITVGRDQGKTQLGVWELAGNTLTGRMGEAGATDRPTDLAPSPGYWVFVATKKAK